MNGRAGSCFRPGQEPASYADHNFSQKMPASEHAGQKHQEPVPPETDQAGSVNVETGMLSGVGEQALTPGGSVCCQLWNQQLVQFLHEELTHSVSSR